MRLGEEALLSSCRIGAYEASVTIRLNSATSDFGLLKQTKTEAVGGDFQKRFLTFWGLGLGGSRDPMEAGNASR
jgi:hypothetical protein